MLSDEPRLSLRADTKLGDREERAYVEPLAFIISKNIHRRHLTKLEQAELIVLARKAAKPHQADVVSEREWGREIPPRAKGGRGKVNEEKAEIVALAADAGISKPTVEGRLPRSRVRAPKPKPKAQPKELPDDYGRFLVAIHSAREHYASEFAKIATSWRGWRRVLEFRSRS